VTEVKQPNVVRLRDLISTSIEAAPHKLDGYKWCKMAHRDRCDALGISEKTLRRMIGPPPGYAPFVSTCRVIDGTRTTLLRVGEPGPQTAEDIARMMVAIWRKRLRQEIPKKQTELNAEKSKLASKIKMGTDDKQEVTDRITAIDKTLSNLRGNETPKEYGCMVGLAKEWPAGMQVPMFNMVLDRWPEFMAGVKSAQVKEMVFAKNVKPLYFEHPHIATLRRYQYVAVELVTMDYQKSGKAPPASLKAVNPGLWKYLKPKASK
jgi:hypothetical protein